MIIDANPQQADESTDRPKLTVYVGGVVHNDPLGPQDLVRWIKNLRDQHADPPQLVALEFNRDFASRMRRQLSQIAPVLVSKVEGMSTTEAGKIANGYWYEPSSVASTLPGVRKIWLEDGVPMPVVGSNQAALWASSTAAKHTLLARAKFPETGDAEALSRLYRTQTQDPKHNGNYERDERWYRTLAGVLQNICGWSIVVVGKAHANPLDSRCLAGLLTSDENMKCIASDVWQLPEA